MLVDYYGAIIILKYRFVLLNKSFSIQVNVCSAVKWYLNQNAAIKIQE